MTVFLWPLKRGVYSAAEVKKMKKPELKAPAEAMVKKAYGTPAIKKKVLSSPEPIRAIVHESGLVSNPDVLDDGGKVYSDLTDFIEKVY